VLARKYPSEVTAQTGQGLLEAYRDVRARTEALCGPLTAEDQQLQSMAEASPTKWHLAHTTWFFETFVLAKTRGYVPIEAGWHELFNSYYETLGRPLPRNLRALLSRPSLEDVMRWRAHVDDAIRRLLETTPADLVLVRILHLGIHHEWQHQELILTDIKHAFSHNPLRPFYRPDIAANGPPRDFNAVRTSMWSYSGGRATVGHDGNGFSFDNERPRHDVLLRPFSLASRLVTCGEYLEFMNVDGYRRPEFWLADGWTAVMELSWQAPLYWLSDGVHWWIYTLGGWRELDESEPVCHVSYYEADAYARWCGARLPTEHEWELVAGTLEIEGNFVESRRLHPASVSDQRQPVRQMFGDAWEWTASPYVPYPGFRAEPVPLGEYNGKFMCGHMVLRGGSCLSPRAHVRATYRNFFPPHTRWQMTGIRLARDV